jgi:hypothetical protein
LKENLLWVRTFDTIEELRAALVEFASLLPGAKLDAFSLHLESACQRKTARAHRSALDLCDCR